LGKAYTYLSFMMAADARRSEGQSAGAGEKGQPAPGCNVYVCNLPLIITEEQIKDLFVQYGEIRDCKILVNPKTQEPRGVAFVHFKSAEDAKSAIEGVDGLQIPGHDKALECRLAKPNARAGTGGGGGVAEEADWECMACRFVNWARRGQCHECGALRGETRRAPPRGYRDYYPPPRRGDVGGLGYEDWRRYEEDEYYRDDRYRGYGGRRGEYDDEYYGSGGYGPAGGYGGAGGGYRYREDYYNNGPPPPRGGYRYPPPDGPSGTAGGQRDYESYGAAPSTAAPTSSGGRRDALY